jgi:Flp pilus assembly protein TadD
MHGSLPRDQGSHRERAKRSRVIFPSISFLLFSFLPAFPALGQDVGSQDKESFGNGSVITVRLHDSAGGLVSSPAAVRLLVGMTPGGQRDTARGVAEFVVTRFGDYAIVVSAPGYDEARKDITVDVAGTTQVDIYLRPSSSAKGPTAVPGAPLLAPKAKEAFEKGLLALGQNRLGEAEKYLGTAMRMAPGNPDVLYFQGVLNLKQQNWKQAQSVLEKATQLDPASARSFAALGMALCNQRSYEAAIAPLTKSLQLDPNGTWETQWALGKSYYHLQRYEEALQSSQQALEKSNGKGPAIALLVAQSLTALGRYEDAARVLHQFLRDHPDLPEAATARRWLTQLADGGHIRPG